MNADGAVLIHCHAGKDRTGILAAILSLIANASTKQIYQDYLASDNDTRIPLLKIALDHIEESGGITEYLKDAGFTTEEFMHLKKMISNA